MIRMDQYRYIRTAHRVCGLTLFNSLGAGVDPHMAADIMQVLARKKQGLSQSGDFGGKRLGVPRRTSAEYAYSQAKIFFQSFFMEMTTQPFVFASASSAGVKVPILLSGRPRAGP